MRVFALCAIGSGVELLRLLKDDIPIDGVIGLSERESTASISGYTDLVEACNVNGWAFHAVNSYSLASAEDRVMIEKLPVDILIVAGWQRLIPEWLIKHVSTACIGVHGSADGVAAGRGRSPQNWALIAGADRFELSIFFIDQGVDTGAIIDTRTFPITRDDDIVSSYLKVNLNAASMIKQAFSNGAIASRVGQPQAAEGEYLPQRLPEDGEIDWSRSAEEIVRFVAALTRPYPGAFSRLSNGETITIWKARSLGMRNVVPTPGRVHYRTSAGGLVVESGTDFLFVEEHSDEQGQAVTGVCFRSANFHAQMTTIADRHRSRNPEQPLSRLFLQLLEPH